MPYFVISLSMAIIAREVAITPPNSSYYIKEIMRTLAYFYKTYERILEK